MTVNGCTNWETFQVHEWLGDDDETLEMYNESAAGDVEVWIELVKDLVWESMLNVEQFDSDSLHYQIMVAFWQTVDYSDLAESHFKVINPNEESEDNE